MAKKKIANIDAQDEGEHAAFLAAVEEGLADAEYGRTVPYEKVRRWLLSWGTDKELPSPKCR
jgi:predicted transcriptional regulator